jgi:hypothetical protein
MPPDHLEILAVSDNVLYICSKSSSILNKKHELNDCLGVPALNNVGVA